jgi:hypothetical protein
MHIVLVCDRQAVSDWGAETDPVQDIFTGVRKNEARA